MECEDRLADLTDGLVHLIDRPRHPLPNSVIEARRSHGPLQLHPGREESLDDEVVQITRNAIAVLVDRKPALLMTRLREDECHGSLGGEGLRKLHDVARHGSRTEIPEQDHDAERSINREHRQGEHRRELARSVEVEGHLPREQGRTGVKCLLDLLTTREHVTEEPSFNAIEGCRSWGSRATPVHGPAGLVRPRPLALRSDAHHLDHESPEQIRHRDERGISTGERPNSLTDDGKDICALSAAQHRVRDRGDGLLPSLALPTALVEPGVLDCHRGGGSQRHHRSLVFGVESGRSALLGEIEVAEDLTSHAHGNAEEGLHRWVAGREPRRRRVVRESIEPDRHRVLDEQAQNPLAGRQRADRLRQCGVDSDMNEVDDLAISPEDTERAVLGIDEIDRSLHNAAKGGSELKAGRD